MLANLKRIHQFPENNKKKKTKFRQFFPSLLIHKQKTEKNPT